jgi:hypothetical protein
MGKVTTLTISSERLINPVQKGDTFGFMRDVFGGRLPIAPGRLELLSEEEFIKGGLVMTDGFGGARIRFKHVDTHESYRSSPAAVTITDK